MTNQSDEKMGNTWLAAEMRSKSNLKPSLLNTLMHVQNFGYLEYLNQKLAISGFSISRGRLPGNGKEIEIIGVVEV